MNIKELKADFKIRPNLLELMKKEGADPVFTASELAELSGYPDTAVHKQMSLYFKQGKIKKIQGYSIDKENKVKLYFLTEREKEVMEILNG